MSEMAKFCENAFTYLKRVTLCTHLEGKPVTLENVMKALNRIDRAHFKRLTETLNVENVKFTRLHEKYEGVYHLHCESSWADGAGTCSTEAT
eukprot:5467157-Amphidinium_carterae.1